MSTMISETFRYDPYSPEAMRDPHSLYPSLREEHPAYFIPEYDAWVFSRYQDVWDGFMDNANYTEAEGQVFPQATLLQHFRENPPQPKLHPEKSMFLFLDPPVHTKFRMALGTPFLKGNIGKLAPLIRKVTQERLAELLPLGQFDINADFASYITVRMTAELMGLQLDDPAHVVELINRMVARVAGKPGASPDGEIARRELFELLMAEAGRRRAGIGRESPIIDPLLSKDLVGHGLSNAEIAVDLIGILVGGTETVPKVFGGGLLELQRRPDQLAAVAADPHANSAQAWEEMLRYNAPAQWFGRTAKHPVTLGGVDIRPGQRVILLIAAANRDPREFTDPDAFIWNRKARRMLSFGVGPHFCIGIHLARLEGAIMLAEFLSTVRSYEMLSSEGNFAESEFQIGWTSLPVRTVT